ncbi:MAG: hypothetical protein U9N46_04155 [Euryarchaeota archaeon]|nr:hypothetical protein [Euryarchaeota archaeon]
MTVGINLRAVCDNGTIMAASLLDIDEEQYASDITSSVAQAFNLAIAIAYPTAATIHTLLAKASCDARNLGINSAIPEPGIIDALLLRAHSQAVALSGSITDPAALGESLGQMIAEREEVKEADEAKAEETATEETVDVEEAGEEDKEGNEEEAAEGLGLLFG